MLLVPQALEGYDIVASDGRLGHVRDLLFDDRSWAFRWIVVNTGSWLSKRLVLIHPSATLDVDHERRTIRVNLSRLQVENSPDIAEDRPVSQQAQRALFDYYGWNSAFGPVYFGMDAMGSEESRARSMREEQQTGDTDYLGKPADPHLRSAAAVSGYHIEANDGLVGHLENFLFDDQSWGIRYLIVDTLNWWPGRHVLLAPYAVTAIDWDARTIRVSVSRDLIKTSPPWDPADIIDQADEKRIHAHYGWPGYDI
jgi:hypothetical protein